MWIFSTVCLHTHSWNSTEIQQLNASSFAHKLNWTSVEIGLNFTGWKLYLYCLSCHTFPVAFHVMRAWCYVFKTPLTCKLSKFLWHKLNRWNSPSCEMWPYSTLTKACVVDREQLAIVDYQYKEICIHYCTHQAQTNLLEPWHKANVGIRMFAASRGTVPVCVRFKRRTCWRGLPPQRSSRANRWLRAPCAAIPPYPGVFLWPFQLASFGGIISLLPLKIRPSSTNSSSLNYKYVFSTSFAVLTAGWPPCLRGFIELLQHCVVVCGVLQFDHLLLRQHHVVIEHPLIDIATHVSFGSVPNARFNVSATYISEPFLYHSSSGYFCSRSLMRYRRFGAMCIFLSWGYFQAVCRLSPRGLHHVRIVVEPVTREHHRRQFLLDLCIVRCLSWLCLHRTSAGLLA